MLVVERFLACRMLKRMAGVYKSIDLYYIYNTQLPTTFEYVHNNEIVIDSILESSVHEDGDSFKKEQHWIITSPNNIPLPHHHHCKQAFYPTCNNCFEYVHKNEIIIDSILVSSVHEDGNSFSMNVCCHTKRETRIIRCTYLGLYVCIVPMGKNYNQPKSI